MSKLPDLNTLFDYYCEVYISSDLEIAELIEKYPMEKTIRSYKKEAFAFMKNDMPLKKRLAWINILYTECKFKEYDILLDLLRENSKMIRRTIEKIILDKEKRTRQLLEQLYPQLEEETRNWIKQLFKYWDNMRLSKTKIKFKDHQAIIDYCAKHIELYCTQQILWLPPKPYTRIPWATGGEDDFIPRHVIRYILGEYMTVLRPIRLVACDTMVTYFDQEKWLTALEQLFQVWLDDGAEAKKRNILLPYCLYGNDAQLEQIRSLIREWVKSSRKALAGFTLGLLGLRATPEALRILDEWIELMPDNQFRREALKTFGQVAAGKGITPDELADRIIPTFGFNQSGEKEIDYGQRSMRITLLPDFSISVFDSSRQKTSRSLPAPLKSEYREKDYIDKLRREQADMPKFVNRQRKVQKKRLEKALKNGRTWTAQEWQAAITDNPVMRFLTIGLIWGIYNDDRLLVSFRHSEDGKLVTLSGKELIPPKDATIKLVHPMELANDILDKWKEYLEKNDIEPLLPQLSAPVYRLEEKDKQEDAIVRYAGRMFNPYNILEFESKDLVMRLEEGVLYMADRAVNTLVQLVFKQTEDICTIQELYFSPFEEGTDLKYTQLPVNERLPLSSVPERYISGILDLLVNAFE